MDAKNSLSLHMQLLEANKHSQQISIAIGSDVAYQFMRNIDKAVIAEQFAASLVEMAGVRNKSLSVEAMYDELSKRDQCHLIDVDFKNVLLKSVQDKQFNGSELDSMIDLFSRMDDMHGDEFDIFDQQPFSARAMPSGSMNAKKPNLEIKNKPLERGALNDAVELITQIPQSLELQNKQSESRALREIIEPVKIVELVTGLVVETPAPVLPTKPMDSKLSIQFVAQLIDGVHRDTVIDNFLSGYKDIDSDQEKTLLVHDIFTRLDGIGHDFLMDMDMKSAILTSMIDFDFEALEKKFMVDLLSKTYLYTNEYSYLNQVTRTGLSGVINGYPALDNKEITTDIVN